MSTTIKQSVRVKGNSKTKIKNNYPNKKLIVRTNGNTRIRIKKS